MAIRTYPLTPGCGIQMKDIGQEYRVVGLVPYVRRDGTKTELALWVSHCPACRQPFAFFTPTVTTFSPNRRCRRCAKPGRRVVAKKRKGIA